MSYDQGSVAAFQTYSQPMSVSSLSPVAQTATTSGIANVALQLYCASGNAQTLTSGAETFLHYDATAIPGGSVTVQPCFSYVASTGIATCTVAGTYYAIAEYNAPSATNLASQQLVINLYKNAGIQAQIAANYGAHAGGVVVKSTLSLAVGDTIKVGVTQTSGGAVAVTDGNTSSTNLLVLRLF